MSKKHTPGPWSCNNKVGVVFGPDCQVAKCGDFFDAELIPFNADRWNADARLIAAAPELLEALEAVDLARMTDEPKHWSAATELTDKALAKARGQ